LILSFGQETTYKPHELTSEQETILKERVATLPSCMDMDMGMGKIDLKEHVIEVT